jgi:Zn-dependent protease
LGDFRLGSIFGFEIRIDFSWFIIFFLILWSFSASVFPAQIPGQPAVLYLTMGTLAALLFFASLLAHELAHSLVARAKGIPVEGITLFIFGGMARMRLEAEDARDEFQIAAVGPASSLAIAGLFALVWRLGLSAGWHPAVTVTAGYLGFLNALLAVFNLMPGFPLDGGRVFRALVWRITGDPAKATRWAAAAGRWFGYLLMAFGALQLFGGAVLGGMWLIFIGWFLQNAAGMSLRQYLVRNLLEGVGAREIMTADPDAVPDDLPLQELVDDHFLQKRHHAFPVVAQVRPVGLVTLQHVKQVPRHEWPGKRVRDVMTKAEGITVSPWDSVSRVMEVMQEAGERRVLVVRDDRLVGLISASDVAAWLQHEEELAALRTAAGSG